MLRRTKRSIIGLVVAASVATILPAPANAALGPCQAPVAIGGVHEWQQTVVVVGEYKANGLDVRLTCGIVRQGQTVARVSETIPGPVAVVGDTVDVLAGTISVCYEVDITYIDGGEYIDTCP